MNIGRNLTTNFKRTVRKNADRFLSPEIQDELGISNKVQASDVTDDFNTFWSPVQANVLASSNQAEKISAWVIGAVAVLCIVLLVAIFSLVAPNSKSFSTNEGNVVVVDGESKTISKEPKKATNKTVEEMTSEEINVQNIVVSSEDLSEVASKSPMLSSGSASVMEYKVRNGDTLERICVKFYGEYNSELIQKLKLANNIRNARYLRVGQKLIIPYN